MQQKPSVSARKLKKRRFKEIDNTAWDLNIDQGSQSVIATQ